MLKGDWLAAWLASLFYWFFYSLESNDLVLLYPAHKIAIMMDTMLMMMMINFSFLTTKFDEKWNEMKWNLMRLLLLLSFSSFFSLLIFWIEFDFYSKSIPKLCVSTFLMLVRLGPFDPTRVSHKYKFTPENALFVGLVI